MPAKDDRSLGEDLINVAVRLPESVLERVDEYASCLRHEAPWAKVGRSDALRALVLEGLKAVTDLGRFPLRATPRDAPITKKIMPEYDPEKFIVGKLCKNGHDYDGLGRSLRYKAGKQDCVSCSMARSQKRTQHKQAERRQQA
jgi:hypothetical protein